MRPQSRLRRQIVNAFAAAALASAASSCGRGAQSEASAFAGSASCASCHATEYSSWKSSQHSVAMQEARPAAVLGKFDGQHFSQGGVTSTFLRRGDRYVVNTEGPDGKLADFEVHHTFGVYPLQQYLADLGRGRIQPLTLAWDARPDSAGGQRWFSLDVGNRVAPDDEFHWTSRGMNWNHVCADCHSTAVRKGYVATADSFHTTWSEIGVGCEACHGPGATHNSRMKYPVFVRGILWRDGGLARRFTERQNVRWPIDSTTGNAFRTIARTTEHEIETCAQCHARRIHVADGYTAGARWMDYYAPELIVPGLYHPDGQQQAEVFTYGSFTQSKMYAAGVTCSDCHDPHTQQLRKPGNAVCGQCHRMAKYDTVTHHRHVAGSPGAKCVACHMPTAIYMEVDPRHDHSMRIPRPDLSVSLGVPNACEGCHRGAAWAAKQVRAWYPKPLPGFQRFATAFAADDRDSPGAVDSLARVAGDSSQPAIVLASALARLGNRPGPVTLAEARRWSTDPRAIVRRAALQALEAFAPPDRVPIALPLLSDSVRSVRLEAVWLVAPMADSLRAPADQRAFAAASAELIESTRYNADRAVSRIALGTFYALRGRLDSAATEYRAAIHLDPRARQPYLYLAEVLRLQGRAAESEQMIREAPKAGR